MSGRDLNAFDDLFQAAGEEYGIDPALIKAHSFVESGINPNTRNSDQGAVGIMQMLPDTARGLGVRNPMDPAQAIRGAAKYIAEGFDTTGSAQDAVRYYHGGPDRRIWGPKTNAYVDKVAAAYDRFSREGMTPKQAVAAAAASPAASAGMSPEDLVGLYTASDGKPATSGGREAPAGGALAIRVRPNSAKSGGLSPEELVKHYASDEAAPSAPAREPGGMMNAAARGVVEGVPIIGPGLLGAIDRSDALVRSLTGGRSYEDEARDARAYGRATDEAHPYAKLGGEIAGGTAAMIPLAMTGAGAVALGVRGAQGAEAALAAARAARAVSQTAETASALRAAQTTNLLTRTTAGGISGFALGGADTAARDFSNLGTDKGFLESIPNRLEAITGERTLHGALIGGGAGGVAPVAGRVLGAAFGPLTNKLGVAFADRFSPVARASNRLMEMTSEAGQTIPELRAELARNPNLALADLNPSLQSAVASLAQGGGAEAAAARQFAAARRGVGGDALRSDFDAAIGAAPDPVALRESLVATAKRNADAGFGTALRDAKPVNLEGLPPETLRAIEDAHASVMGRLPEGAPRRGAPAGDRSADLAEAVRTGEAGRRSGAGATETSAPPKGLSSLSADEAHLVQQELRRRSGELQKSLVGTDRLAGGQTADIRERLLGRIDGATGGKFRPAQRQFADDMSVREAFDAGMTGLDRVRSGAQGLADRPEVLRREFAAMRPEEREAYRQGMRTQIATAMDAARNPARAGEAVTDPGFNRQKLAIIFGDAEAGRLLQAVQDSRRMASTNNLIDSGSKTGQMLLGARSIGMTAPAEASSGIDNAITVAAMVSGRPEIAAGRLALSGARAGISKSGFAADAGRNKLLSEAGLAAGPAGEAVLNKLQAFFDQRALQRLAPGASAARAHVNALLRSSTMVQDNPQR